MRNMKKSSRNVLKRMAEKAVTKILNYLGERYGKKTDQDWI